MPSRKLEHFHVPQYKMRATTKLAQLVPIEKAINLATKFAKGLTIEETTNAKGTCKILKLNKPWDTYNKALKL